MLKSPIPENEEERLAALAEYQILDTSAEEIFDRITESASLLCGVPISLISLIDRERQFYKSNIGMQHANIGVRDTSFCGHAILQDTLFEINDATKDNRFVDNPFVLNDPHIRFYAGMPLINPRGFKLGTLCVIDREPKELTDTQRQILKNLSEIIIKLFEIKKGILNDISQRKAASDALSLVNDQLKSKLNEQKQSRHDLLMLSEMSSVLQSCMSVDETYVVIAKFCKQIIPNSEGALYLLHQSRMHVESAITWGENPLKDHVLTLDECWALRRGQLHHAENKNDDLICKHMQNHPEKPAYLCIPLMAQGDTLGLITLTLQKTNTEQVFTEERRLLAIAMAEQISLALANAKLRETLHSQSIHDPLTGLFNRRHLADILKVELPKLDHNHTTAAFMLLDIDFFKKFNDEYGHEAGDLVLVEIAGLLTKLFATQALVFRFGGEEFFLYFRSYSLSQAVQAAELIAKQTRLLTIMHHGTKLPPITYSTGIAIYPLHAKSPETLIKLADDALYRAKESGRDCIMTAECNENISLD